MPKKARNFNFHDIYYKISMGNAAATLGSPRDIDVIAKNAFEAISKAYDIFSDKNGEWGWARNDIEFEKCENMGTIYL